MPSTHGNTNKCCCCCCCKVKVYTVTKTEISHLYNDVIFSFIFVLTVSIETGLTLLHKSEGQLQSAVWLNSWTSRAQGYVTQDDLQWRFLGQQCWNSLLQSSVSLKIES